MFSKKEVKQIIEKVVDLRVKFDQDHDGQVVIYTGLYTDNDGNLIENNNNQNYTDAGMSNSYPYNLDPRPNSPQEAEELGLV